MTIFIFKGYAADVTEIKRLQYAAGEEEAKDAATRIVAAAVGNTAVGFSAKATLTGFFIQRSSKWAFHAIKNGVMM
jgi:hypothetical protein